MSGEPVKVITSVRQVDADGNVVAETVTTVEHVKAPAPASTGQYL